MAIIGDSGLSGLIPGNSQANQPNAPQARETSGSGGTTARGGSSDRDEGVIVDLSATARAVAEAPADAVSSAANDSGVGDRDIQQELQADRAERRSENDDIRQEAAVERRDAASERRERVDFQV
ncbi:hypothetical protein GCM10007972_14560 [Iodidimonas muriae]|uniref:Uncharacterized protein n=1 Tax=Iodidimonas muriae TaxID=261467 RepID=A0ABQ2LCY5_9PROT|nr:hypothetical protein [Iodidimonas muriae]GER07295.1 hypothetical protein JCM17843_16050 [Kordiimonadales bacterium JCM 17843]GGO11075.1 hypothetical protein GCM10007972_14560 [Iodidimonas muriae]